jgi:hypothetical protein
MAYQSFTWSAIRQRLRERLELKAFWSDDELLVAFNEALSVWNLATGYWRTRVTQPTIAGQYDYALPASMLYRMRITVNNLPLTSTNREDLNQGRYTWRAETTASGGSVPTRPMIWAPIDLYTFLIWPADAVGGATLTIDGVAATPVLVHDGDFVDLGEELFTTLLGYALHVLTFKKGGPAFQATLPLFQTFLAEAAEENSQIKTSQIFRRVMGLDDRGFKLLQGTPTQLDRLVSK